LSYWTVRLGLAKIKSIIWIVSNRYVKGKLQSITWNLNSTWDYTLITSSEHDTFDIVLNGDKYGYLILRGVVVGAFYQWDDYKVQRKMYNSISGIVLWCTRSIQIIHHYVLILKYHWQQLLIHTHRP
jgi:hypothetical protein